MKLSQFNYHIPKNRIAQRSVRPRDMSRLMVLDRARERVVAETRFREIGDFLRSGDLLVINDTKVFRARLFGRLETGARVELLLLGVENDGSEFSVWKALARPGRKLSPGTVITFDSKSTFATAVAKVDHGVWLVRFNATPRQVMNLTDRIGEIPVPPYVKEAPRREELYQTVYAKHRGSVAAPTAGFHFTKRLIASLKEEGIRFAPVTLHVGLGTFQPIVAEDINKHRMHAEWAEISPATIRAIRETKKRGGRVIAVGTTTLRALEGLLRGRDVHSIMSS